MDFKFRNNLLSAKIDPISSSVRVLIIIIKARGMVILFINRLIIDVFQCETILPANYME